MRGRLQYCATVECAGTIPRKMSGTLPRNAAIKLCEVDAWLCAKVECACDKLGGD